MVNSATFYADPATMYMDIILAPIKETSNVCLDGKAHIVLIQFVRLVATGIKVIVRVQMNAIADLDGKVLLANNVLDIQVACMDLATGRMNAFVKKVGVDFYVMKVSSHLNHNHLNLI